MAQYELKHLQFKHPFTALVTGPTGSGKTCYVREILDDYKYHIHGISKPRVIWAHGQWQPLYKESLKNIKIKYTEGLPSLEEIQKSKANILVLDDLMTTLAGDAKLSRLFTIGSHHYNLSIFFLVQNMFYKAKEMVTVNRNTHYNIYMKNPRDLTPVEVLGKQMFPGKKGFLRRAYLDATSVLYEALIIDTKADTPDELRIRTGILRSKNNKKAFNPIIYTPK